MRVFCFTSQKYAHLMRPFSLLFNHFWSASQPVVIAGVSSVDFDLPSNFSVSPAGANRPAKEWQQGVREFLESVTDDYFIVMLEDYFLSRPVDVGGVKAVSEYMKLSANCVRMDLTTDVLHAYGDGRQAREVESYGHYDIVEKWTDASYRSSLQASIFSREYMIGMCARGGSPWEFELYNKLQGDTSVRVLGCRQWPVRYANAVDKGRINWQQIGTLPPGQIELIKPMLQEPL